MNISIFNKYYWIRRFGKQKYINGYATTSHEDFSAFIHVYPSTDSSRTQPEGERKEKKLQGAGNIPLVSGDQDTQKKGDLLYYHGKWYECVSCNLWDSTGTLNHYNYEFNLVPEDAAGTIDLKEPDGSPGKNKGGIYDDGKWR